MKTRKYAILAALAFALSATESFAVVDQTLQVQGTNLVLSWPSLGYEYYIIQYWPALDPGTQWVQLTNCLPANSTNRTTYIIPCCALNALGGGSNSASVLSEGSSGAAATPGDSGGSTLWPQAAEKVRAALSNAVYSVRASQAGHSPLSLSSTYEGSEPDSPADLTSGGCECPDKGFLRVWHIPDWAFNVTNYTYDGPTFFPVDFKDYVDRVVNVELLLDGQATGLADFTSLFYNGQTNWGMGIYFDRVPNGTHQIQLVSTLHLDDEADDGAVFLVLSNLTRSILVNNQVMFTNWDDMVWNNTNYTFRAQTKTNNTDWAIDIYDAFGFWINGATGHTANGSIDWTWDLRDYNGNLRDDLDFDPFFDPWVTFYTAAAAQTSRPTPLFIMPYPAQGAWLISFLDNFYEAGTSSNDKMVAAMHGIQGWVDYRDVPTLYFPIAYGTNSYTQAERDGDWRTLSQVLSNADFRNFYYFGHGNGNSIGGDVDRYDSNGNVIGTRDLPHSKAHLDSSAVQSGVTSNKTTGVHYYRFVWLDGCSTSAGGWPKAFGVNKATNDIGYYTNSVSNPSHKRPSAFAGWSVRVGGSAWGTVTPFFYYRSEWIKDWSYYWITKSLVQAFDDAISTSGWPPGTQGQLWGALRVYGYTVLRMNEYNLKTDWPGP